MKIEQLVGYDHDEKNKIITTSILVDGVKHEVVDYCDRYAPVSYQILKDGVEVEPERASAIYKAQSGVLEDFITDVINTPELEVVED